MSETGDTAGDCYTIRPSLARNLLYSTTSAGLAAVFVYLAQAGETEALPAYLAAFVLTIGAGVLLAAHFPDATYIRLTEDGFEIRELFKSRHYRWQEVTAFAPRRRLLGTTIEYAYFDPESGQPTGQVLPTGFGISVFRLLQLMNEWRDRAVGPEET